MFYCNPCGTQKGWPTDTLMQSHGPCEICETTAICNDVPSQELPSKLPESEPETRFQSDFDRIFNTPYSGP